MTMHNIDPKLLDGWIARGLRLGATHMLVMCDTFSYEDYPVYVQPGQSLYEVESEYSCKEMQRIVDTVDLSNQAQQNMG